MRGITKGQWGERAACLALFALCLLPFLVPLHTLPLTNFYSEWLALALGIVALVGFAGRAGLAIPRVAILPVGLGLLILLQYLWLPAGLRTGALIGLLYLLWASLLMLLVATLLQRVPLQKLANGLTLALAFAALLNACNVILFYAGLRTGFDWLFLRPDRAGNLGQANMLADLLWLGIVSVLYHWHGCQRHGWLYVAWLVPLLIASALTGSRSPMLYALWIALAGALFADPRLRRAAVLVAASYFVCVTVVHCLPLPTLLGNDSISRMLPAGSVGGGGSDAHAVIAPIQSIRLSLLEVAGRIFLEHPWFGAGWGSFAWESYVRADELRGTMAVGEHAHQIFFQLAAELGFAAPLLLLGVLLCWAWPIWQTRGRLRVVPVYWWIVSAIGVMLIHAQLEYPFWYAYALGIFAILLVCGEQRMWVLNEWRCSPLLVAALLVTGAYLLGSSMIDYRRLERWLYTDMRRGSQVAPPGHYQVLADLSQDSLLQPQALRALAAVMPPTAEQLQGKREVCRQALRSEPQSPAVFTCALLDARAGEEGRAVQDMRQARLVFPDEFREYRQRMLKELSPAELDRYRHLLELPAGDKAAR